MEQFQRVEKHLYKRQYRTATGDWRTLFYVIFTDWKGVRRTFPADNELDDARDKLGELRTMNKGRYDWDKEKRERARAKVKAMTLTEWLDRYLDLVKSIPSFKTKKAQCAHLKRLLGSLPLSGVTRVKIMEYKNRRLSEALIRHGEAVEDTRVQGSTVNREVSCLIHALNLAADEGLCEGAPRVKKERETPRERTLTDAERKALLEALAPARSYWSRRGAAGPDAAAQDDLGLD